MHKENKKGAKIHRAIFLLFLLKVNNNEPIVGITRLEKLMFLIISEVLKDTQLNGNYYVFEPYKYGPFSSGIFDDVQLMEDMGYITREKLNEGQTKFVITGKGIEKIDDIMHKFPENIRKYLEKIQNEIAIIKSEKNSISLRKLLSYVYQKYPEFTINSEIKDKIHSY